jgi:RimJ/RimL family protein N-acetyltransferase
MKELPEVLIREWKREDLEPLVAQADNIKVWNNLRNYFPHPYTKENGQAWLDTVIGASPIVNLAIQADGELAGGIGLILNGDVYQKSAELGYWLGEPFWGQGIATEAVRQMVEYGFYYFDIVRMYAEVFENNKASMRVLEKNGFYLEGVRRKAVYKNEVLMDDYIWVTLRKW